ncbi:MAG TPA: DUF4286 family protein [Puia sp.]|nr:DUF4286 family protein [Puia sp.]
MANFTFLFLIPYFLFSMIVYNISTKVPWYISDEWLIWQQEEYIPEIMQSNLFDDYKIYRIMDLEEDEGPTYTVQYFTSDKERYQQYIEEFAPILREKAFARWGNQLLSFHSAMELVN